MTPAEKLDAMPEDEARAALARCCAARRWAEGMLARRPFGTTDALLAAADEVWSTMGRDDLLEAFAGHPRIGGDLDALRERWSAEEQSGVGAASEQTLRALRDGNLRYEERFGHIFIVCATGKSAGEMLALLCARLDNTPGEELRTAAAEQGKITRIRLEKL